VKQDGLVHISQLSNTYVSDPNTVVKLQQKVMVTVLEVDIARKRISLSMKGNAQAAGKPDDGVRRPDRDGGRKKGVGGRGRGEAPKGKPDKEQKESPEDFQAKLMALKKKFK
jgi:uncharacterized protein